jgi:pantoate--beta-alanine ligase
VTIEAAAERVAATAGVPRAALVPLVRAAVENWAALGAQGALTGPIARGDEAVVARQRMAVAARAPELIGVFDALAGATRDLARCAPVRHRGARMRTVRTVADLRAALRDARRAERTIGLVPTMGALHDGHLSLVRAARAENDVVVVSLFVNPTQFNEAADLDAYPRDEARDTEAAAAAGTDLLFAPSADEVYPPGFATTVRIAGLTEHLEGEHRGIAHFEGVATVVCKLLNMAQPDVAYFGQKDAQQAAVIRRLVRDLDIPVRIAVQPTVREPDGLALSSRNVHLKGADRERALALRRALDAAAETVAAGERDPHAVERAGRAAMARLGVEAEYVALVRPDDLRPVERIDGDVLVAVAARVGPTRLIDNTILHAQQP